MKSHFLKVLKALREPHSQNQTHAHAGIQETFHLLYSGLRRLYFFVIQSINPEYSAEPP